jgi:UDP:flavonoid glycosyltransferase YjiC (YdhE family)
MRIPLGAAHLGPSWPAHAKHSRPSTALVAEGRAIIPNRNPNRARGAHVADGRTIVFFPEGAYGPTNNCVGIGTVLRERGHRVVFIVEESFAGGLEAQGFEERLMRLGPPPEEPEVPGQFWIDFIRDTAPVFRKPTIEQLGEFIAPTFQALIDGSIYVQPRLEAIVDELRPDTIVEDNVVSFPAIMSTAEPWVRLLSCNPAEIKDPLVAPFSSGYPADDRSAWPAFLDEVDRTHRDMWTAFDAFCRVHGLPALPWTSTGPDFMHESPFLNLYSYPAEADYARSAPLGPTWHQLDSTVRAADTTWTLPGTLAGRDGALIYLSLGSLGSADVALMQRLVDLLGQTRHRVIVSKGPLADQITLRDNMTGEAFLPQPAILPQVDLVITHGGNNTVVESFHHGKPMIVLPLFWDQVDNAQRVDETGFGRRLATYDFEDEELLGAIDELVADEGLAARRAAVAGRMQATGGTVHAADLIERVAITKQPVTR